MISTSNLNKIKPKKTAISLSLIILFGLAIRFYFVPTDLPIVSDGFFDFVYAAKTVFEGGLPIGYGTTNTGWANFLSLFFSVSDTSDPFYLMEIQRSLSIILSTITIIPAFFIFRRFVDTRWAIFGSVLLIMEPRLLMMSLEGINYSLFIFIFVLAIALFLNKTNISLFLSFGCIACATLVRYEGLLLLIPLSIMYFVKFNDKKSIIKFLGMIFIIIIILAPMSVLRMQATENICYESVFGVRCGDDGFTHAILAGPRFLSQTLTVMPSQETPETTTPMIDENKDKTDGYTVLSENKIITGFMALLKFIGLALIPYFVFFVSYNIILRIKNKKLVELDWDKKMIVLTTGIMLLPALYAYMRGIEEIRYVLVLIPLVCILSISWTNKISEQIPKKMSLLVILIVLVVISSIIFIEYKQVSDYHRELFLVSQKIVELTDTSTFHSNTIFAGDAFHKDGYTQAVLLGHNWPYLPEPNESGKLTPVFHKISSKNSNDIKHFITESQKIGLQYIVIDEDAKFFVDLHKDPSKYPYLDKVFDSDDYDFMSHFRIYKINYEKMI